MPALRTHLALLRGINVGGRNKVAMADLRRVVAGLGHSDVATYIQSGNVLFAAQGGDVADLAREIEEAVARETGVTAAVIVVTRAGLDRVIAANPFGHEPNPKAVHAVFLGQEPTTEQLAGLDRALQRTRDKGSRDTAEVVGEALYLWTPDGLGRSVLAAELNRKGNPTGTARNWATVTTLASMFEA